MNIQETFYFTLWMSVALIMILSLILVGCTPLALKETELAAEGVEEVVQYIEKEKQLNIIKK